MRYLITALALLSIPSAGFAVDTEIIINGPSFGIEENIDRSYYRDARPILKNAGFGLALYNKPIYVSISGRRGWSSYYNSETSPYPPDSEEGKYLGTGGFVTGGYELIELGVLKVFIGGSLNYQRTDYEKGELGYYYDWDGYSEDPTYAVINDYGDVTEFGVTGGAVIGFKLAKRFSSYTYFGYGYGKVENTGIWTMGWAPYPVRDDAQHYENSASGTALYLNSNNDVRLWGIFGLNIGVELTKRPASPGYMYIPESYFRYSEWDNISYNVWVGPSFEL